MGISPGGHRTLREGERLAREGKAAELVYLRPTLNLRISPALNDRMRACADACEVSLNAFAQAAIADMCTRVERKRSKEQQEGNDYE